MSRTQWIDSIPVEERNLPFKTGEMDWRSLAGEEIVVLEKAGCHAQDWSMVRVGKGFETGSGSDTRIQNCRFFGLVRVGRQGDGCLEHNGLRLSAGLYGSVFENCDVAEDVAIHNVGRLVGTRVDTHAMLFNVGEIVTRPGARFGSGVPVGGLDRGAQGDLWMNLANENGGRRVLPFAGMLEMDAWLWYKFRDDGALMERFTRMTETLREGEKNSFSVIGEGSVVEDCRILRDIRLGPATYIRGCNTLEDLSVASSLAHPTEILGDCELASGVLGRGCRVSHGVKAERFVLCDHARLNRGARFSDSLLGSNSTVSCGEVLNSLMFGFHEQHHNNSFLCSAVVGGQTNIAAGATIGSNHNSRAPDGELVVGRGFWPGLSVTLKHYSYFAEFCLIAKGAYPGELDVRLPFCLVSNSVDHKELHLRAGFWFRYNMYAMVRNSEKWAIREKREARESLVEYDWLAPDTVASMRRARALIECWVGLCFDLNSREAARDFLEDGVPSELVLVRDMFLAGKADEEIQIGPFEGEQAMEGGSVDEELDSGETSPPMEHEYFSDSVFDLEDEELASMPDSGWMVDGHGRPVRLIRPARAWQDYGRMMRLYAVRAFARVWSGDWGKRVGEEKPRDFFRNGLEWMESLIEGPEEHREIWNWVNLGGMVVPEQDVEWLKEEIKSGRAGTWEELHAVYNGIFERTKSRELPLASMILREMREQNPGMWKDVAHFVSEALETLGLIMDGVKTSRLKDYNAFFRSVTFNSPEERDAVLGRFEDDEFILRQQQIYQESCVQLQALAED